MNYLIPACLLLTVGAAVGMAVGGPHWLWVFIGAGIGFPCGALFMLFTLPFRPACVLPEEEEVRL